MNKWPRFALNALGLTLSLSGSAFAQLAAVDPGPYTFATGKFPMWYQDNNQLSMELCQSRAASSRVRRASVPPAYMCILLPEPGIFDDTLPMVFPDNWPAGSVLVPRRNHHPQQRRRLWRWTPTWPGSKRHSPRKTRSTAIRQASRGFASG